MKKKTIAIIGTNGLPGRYGGWDQLMNNLTSDLRDEFNFTVYTSSYNAVEGVKEVNGAKIKIINLKANGWQSVPYDVVSLFDASLKYDILLILGTSGCIVLPLVRLFRKKLILNPDGAEWKRGKWNTPVKLFLKFSEYIGIKFANRVVADNKVISQYIENTHGKKPALIEYGGDNAKFVTLKDETERQYKIKKGKYAFKVCRIEPENNIDLILDAFSKVSMKLILIGNWEFSDYGKKLRNSYADQDNMQLLDPIYHQETLDELRSNCGLYIHGHSVGGTNPSLVEAMNLGLCCLIYDVDYNRETSENKALYFKDREQLIELVGLFQQNKLDTAKICMEMSTVASRRYKWSKIVQKYREVFLN